MFHYVLVALVLSLLLPPLILNVLKLYGHPQTVSPRMVQIGTVILVVSFLFSWHERGYWNKRETTAQQLAISSGYQELTWKSTQYGFMFSVSGCGFFSPTKLTKFEAKKNGGPVSLHVCEWEYISKPVLVEG